MSILTPPLVSQIPVMWHWFFDGAKEASPKSDQKSRDVASSQSSNRDSYVKWMSFAALSLPLAVGAFLWRDIAAKLRAVGDAGEDQKPDAAAREARLAELRLQMKAAFLRPGRAHGFPAQKALNEKRATIALEIFSMTRGTSTEAADAKAARDALMDYAAASRFVAHEFDEAGEMIPARNLDRSEFRKLAMDVAEAEEAALKIHDMTSGVRDVIYSGATLEGIAISYGEAGREDLVQKALLDVVRFDHDDKRPVRVVEYGESLYVAVYAAQRLFYGAELKGAPAIWPHNVIPFSEGTPAISPDFVNPFGDDVLRAAEPQMRVVMLAQNVIASMVQKTGKNPSRDDLQAATAEAFEEVLATYDCVSESRNPGFMTDLHLAAGELYLAAGKTDLALEAYQRAVLPVPDDGRMTVEINHERHGHNLSLAASRIRELQMARDAAKLPGHFVFQNGVRGTTGFALEPDAQWQSVSEWMGGGLVDASELVQAALEGDELAARELQREGDGRLPDDVRAALPRADVQALEGRLAGAEEAAKPETPGGAEDVVREFVKGKGK